MSPCHRSKVIVLRDPFDVVIDVEVHKRFAWYDLPIAPQTARKSVKAVRHRLRLPSPVFVPPE